MVDDTEDGPGADRRFVVRDLIPSLDRGDARTRAMIAFHLCTLLRGFRNRDVRTVSRPVRAG